MDNNLELLIDMSIELELSVGSIYLLFHENFKEDADFWWKLAMEEKNHASLIESCRMSFGSFDNFPKDLLLKQVSELQEINRMLSKQIQGYLQKLPSRKDALMAAYELEQSAAEFHYQTVMEAAYPDEITSLLQELNQDDKDHAQRIKIYMEEHGIHLNR